MHPFPRSRSELARCSNLHSFTTILGTHDYRLRACADRLATFHYLSVLRTIKWAPHHSLIHSLPAYSRSLLVHAEKDKPGRPPRRTLYPFINTHCASTIPRKGYTAEEVSRAYPEFAAEKLLGPTWNSRQRGRDHTLRR